MIALLAARWAVAIVAADPNDAELAQNLNEVAVARLGDVAHPEIVGAETIRTRLNLSGENAARCMGDEACVGLAADETGASRLIVAVLSRGAAGGYVLDAKLLAARPTRVLAAATRRGRHVSEMVDHARSVVDQLRERAGREDALPTNDRRIAPYVVGAAGAATAIAGALLVSSARSDYDQLQKTCAPLCPAASWSDGKEKAGWALVAVGAAAAAGGAVWAIRGGHDQRRAWVAPSLAGIVAGGEF